MSTVETAPMPPAPMSSEALAGLAHDTIDRMMSELAFDSEGEFQPFALLANDEHTVFVEAPLLCVEESAERAWEELTSKIVGFGTRSALVAMPVWVAPTNAVRPGAHPQRVELVVLSGIGGDGRDHGGFMPVHRTVSAPGLGSLEQGPNVVPEPIAARLIAAIETVAGIHGPTRTSGAGPCFVWEGNCGHRADRVLKAEVAHIERELSGGHLDALGTVTVDTPWGMRSFRGPDHLGETAWRALTNIAREYEARMLVIHESEPTGSPDELTVRLLVLDETGSALSAQTTLSFAADADGPHQLGEWSSVDVPRAAEAASRELRRLHDRQRAFERTLVACAAGGGR